MRGERDSPAEDVGICQGGKGLDLAEDEGMSDLLTVCALQIALSLHKTEAESKYAHQAGGGSGGYKVFFGSLRKLVVSYTWSRIELSS